MNGTQPDEDRLWEDALDLVIRLQSDPLNGVTNNLVQNWRARSPAHDAAWREVAEIHGMTGHILEARKRQHRQEELHLTRRSLMIAGAIGVGGAIVAAAVGPRLLLEAQADFITAKAEITVVKLEDGSAATLGPESAIKLAFDDRARRIQLLSGMAYFEVARDEARPFSVTSDQLTATALGTAFDVAADAGYTSVSVQHGSVEVRMPHVQSERLESGQWLSLEGSAQLIERGSRDAGQIAAWRDSQLIVDRERIAAVVSRIGRWHTGSIVLADPDLGARQVSGVFDLGQPLRALEAVVHPYGGKVRQIAPWVTIISKI